MPQSERNHKGVSMITALLLLSLIILPFALTTLVEQNTRDYELSLRSRLKFEIYLREQTTPKELQLLITQVKNLEGFAHFSYRDRQEVFKEMQTALGATLLPDDAPNPFPSVIEISFTPQFSNLAHFERIKTSTEKLAFVEDVNFGSDWLAAHERTFVSAARILTALRFITAACALILMFWFMRRLILGRSDYYMILRRLGAGWRVMALPFILRKTALGVSAACLSLLALYGCFQLAAGWSIDIVFVTGGNMLIVLAFGGLVALLSSTLAFGPGS